MSWELDDKRSIYAQLIDTIRQRIVTGYYAPGAKMDSVRDLAQEAGVNPNTMQRALSELERDGILRAERTAGRFVTDDAEKIASLKTAIATEVIARFTKEMQSLGYSADDIRNMLPKT